MPGPLRLHFSLAAVGLEVRADPRIHRRALDVFIKREMMNSYLAQFVFLIVAVAGYSLDNYSVMGIGVLHCLVDQLARQNLRRLSASLAGGEVDERLLRRVERMFYAVGFVWAMPAWPLAQSLDGLSLILTVVSVAGLLVMANSTCFAPRVFKATVIGFAVGVFAAVPAIRTIPWYLLGGAAAAFLVVVTGVGAATARQLIQMLRWSATRRTRRRSERSQRSRSPGAPPRTWPRRTA